MLQAKRWQRCPSSTISPFPQLGQKSNIAAASTCWFLQTKASPAAGAQSKRTLTRSQKELRRAALTSHWSTQRVLPQPANSALFALPAFRMAPARAHGSPCLKHKLKRQDRQGWQLAGLKYPGLRVGGRYRVMRRHYCTPSCGRVPGGSRNSGAGPAALQSSEPGPTGSD